VDATCKIAGTGSSAGLPCDTRTIGEELCLDLPTALLMKFKGGNCQQSDNDQGQLFTCEDLSGGPPTSEQSYIIVTNGNSGTIYFEGPVVVGDVFPLSDGGNPLADAIVVEIFS